MVLHFMVKGYIVFSIIPIAPHILKSGYHGIWNQEKRDGKGNSQKTEFGRWKVEFCSERVYLGLPPPVLGRPCFLSGQWNCMTNLKRLRKTPWA